MSYERRHLEGRFDIIRQNPNSVDSIIVCNDCGSIVVDQDIHDKFHDAYKPSRKATFAIVHDDNSAECQMIDGTKMTFDAADLMTMEKLQAIVYQMNEQLAPFYEGGDTALIGVSQ
jgi:hypothetical protein